ncbi:MAG: nuclear transport factor 2 family protein [Chloroflexota bacterium]
MAERTTLALRGRVRGVRRRAREWLGRRWWGMLAPAALTVALLVAVAPVGAARVRAQNVDAVAVVRTFGAAWNAHQLDEVLAAFAPDATIQGGAVCCAARGLAEIRPFLVARFAEDHQIGWNTPQVSGGTLTFVARIATRYDAVTVTSGSRPGEPNPGKADPGTPVLGEAGPGDPEAAPITVVVQQGKITSLVLGTSEAALGRARAARAACGC